MHRLAGEQLVEHFGDQSSRIATPLAMHFERGHDFPRAIEYRTQAGDNAIKLYANAEAEAHYSHALALVAKLPREEHPKRYLNLFEKRGRANLALTRLQSSIDDFTRMLDLARASCAASSECVALNALANSFFYSHRLEEMGACAEEAVCVAERLGDERARVEAMVLLAMKRNGSGELADAKLLYDEAISAARHLKQHPALVRGLVYRGVVHFFQTEYELAEALVREALQLASELRDGFTLLQSGFFLGLILGNQGRMSEALQILGETLSMAQRNGDRIILARVPNAMGWIYRELGDLDRAIQYDCQSVEMARNHQIVEAEANSLINLGQDYAAHREGEKARSSFREAEMIFDRDEWLRWRFRDIRFHAGSAEHLLSQGDVERAGEHARELLKNATHHKVPKYIAIAHKLFAELAAARGQFAESEAELVASLEQLSTHPVPILTWKIYAALGRVRIQQGEFESARAAFAQAAPIINSIAEGLNDEGLKSVPEFGAIREVLNE